ncbi:hypothetical protein ACLKA7_012295 [Drosophila subpalustris]
MENVQLTERSASLQRQSRQRWLYQFVLLVLSKRNEEAPRPSFVLLVSSSLAEPRISLHSMWPSWKQHVGASLKAALSDSRVTCCLPALSESVE